MVGVLYDVSLNQGRTSGDALMHTFPYLLAAYFDSIWLVTCLHYSVEALEYCYAYFFGNWVIDISMINYQWSLNWWKILFQNQVVNTNRYSIPDWDFQSKTESFQFHNHTSWKAMIIAMQSIKFGCPIYSDVRCVHGKWYPLNKW